MEQLGLDLGDTEAENKKAKVDEAKAKVKAIAEEVRARKAAERTPNKDFGHTRVGGAGGSEEALKAANKLFKSGGKASSASKRADGCCIRGKTRA